MLVLSGNNLGERHRELNTKVNEAALNKVDFESLKNETEQSDIDKLFKIDLASKYKNIEYIMGVLKSGDPLHISRALKCTWIYDEEFSNFINVDYLQDNVFPYMSLKMRNKLLTAVSINVRDINRVTAFCIYCNNMKLQNIGLKFIPYLSDDLKLEMFRNSNMTEMIEKKKSFKYVIGNSFILAKAYLNKMYCKLHILSEISYLYSISDLQYLDLLDKQGDGPLCSKCEYEGIPRLGLRLSKNIMTKHILRVISKPSVYINFLNKTSITKYIDTENAKICATALLPNKVKKFWASKFCNKYAHILNVVPAEERFEFIKKLFIDKYPGQTFEMDLQFYNQKCYVYMTSEQKNNWAVDQIASKKEILGNGNDYKWYKFIYFEKAFHDVKNLIMATPDSKKRNGIVHILIESAKSPGDLVTVLKYYYDRHNNEEKYYKEWFMTCVANNFNVYEFDNDCWNAFNKILQNLDVYNVNVRTLPYNRGRDFKVIALIYPVIHSMEVHHAIKRFIDDDMCFYTLKAHIKKIQEPKQEILYNYLLKFYNSKIDEIGAQPYEENLKQALYKYINYIGDLRRVFHKPSGDISEAFSKLLKIDPNSFERSSHIYGPVKPTTTQVGLLRLLKKDAKLVVESLPSLKDDIGYLHSYSLCQLLRKLKVYFSNDISKEYFNFYNNILQGSEKGVSRHNAQTACYGIFHLAENNFKVEFMTKYAPTQSKINRSEIDESLLNIQEAICCTAFYSRPSVPLKCMLMYVKGDYVPRCLPMFNAYSMNLPLPLCIEFIEQILNNPVSISKHGLRLAFAYFNSENLSTLSLSIWKKFKNVSLRLVIYKALYDKILEGDEITRATLFGTLQLLTLDLHEDDAEIFTYWKSMKPLGSLMSDYLKSLWTAATALPDSKSKCAVMSDIIGYMYNYFESIRQDVIEPIIKEFIENIFKTEDSIKAGLKQSDFNQSMWNVTVCYITHVLSNDDLAKKLHLTKHILTQCSTRFNVVDENKYIVRKLFSEFIRKILNGGFTEILNTYKYINEIYEMMMEVIQDLFAVEYIYLTLLAIRINYNARKALFELNTKLSGVKEQEVKHVIIRDGVFNFGKDIGTMFLEYIDKNIYFECFLTDIKNELVTNTLHLFRFTRSSKVAVEDFVILVSRALIDFKKKELYVLALNILPIDLSWLQYGEDFMSVLNELKSVNDPEISSIMHDKYIHSDYIARYYFKL